LKDFTNMRTLLYGWGINDSPTKIRERISGKCVICPYYSRWISIVQRGYDPKEKARKPWYQDAFVSEAWKRFTDFKAWLDIQPYWQDLELDKDILSPGNKEYGPQYCVFVPGYVNTCSSLAGSKDNKYLPGVRCTKKGRFSACFAKISLGTCNIELEAHQKWQLAKANYIEETVYRYAKTKYFDIRVAEALTTRVWELRLQCSKGEITYFL